MEDYKQYLEDAYNAYMNAGVDANLSKVTDPSFQNVQSSFDIDWTTKPEE